MAARGIVKTHVRIEAMDKLTDVFTEMSKGASKDPWHPPTLIIPRDALWAAGMSHS
jgi:hypothetical protein